MDRGDTTGTSVREALPLIQQGTDESAYVTVILHIITGEGRHTRATEHELGLCVHHST